MAGPRTRESAVLSRARRISVLLALVAAGCATPVASIPADYALDRANGIVIFRVEYVNGSGEPDSVRGFFQPKHLELTWEQGRTRDLFQLTAATEGPAADFYVALPVHSYWLEAQSADPYPKFPLERRYYLSFTAQPGAVVYAGTIRFEHDYVRSLEWFSLHDDYDATVERFRASHPGLGATVEKSLFEKYVCPITLITECQPQPWGEDGSP